MDNKFAAAGKDVLVQVVKLSQKQGMKGSQGSWKEFLNFYDKKFGASLSDPARRSVDVLVAYLKTLRQEDLKFFDNLIERHSNRKALEQSEKNSPDTDSPEQRLVRSTLEHPKYHIDYSFPSHEEDWMVIKYKRSKAMKSTAMVAVDCEMVQCEDGTDALVRVCVVNKKLQVSKTKPIQVGLNHGDKTFQVKLNELVKPDKPIVDFRTEITGITANDLDGITCSLANIQRSMKKLLSHGTILVGHSLNNDLRALKLDCPRVIDTSLVFKFGVGLDYRRPSLNNLCKSVLGYEVRKKGAPHNCLDDACAAMKLVLAKIERGIDTVIPLVDEEVPGIDMTKLLLHRIPISVSSEELHKIIPGDFNIEMKTNKKAVGEKYSAFMIFKNREEANQAFEDVEGEEDKDSSGRPQKLIPFQLGNGKTASFYVRKMNQDDLKGQVTSKKRLIQDEETFGASKRLKADEEIAACEVTTTRSCSDHECENHLKEISKLKQELALKDREIANLNKILVALTRKHGL